MVNLKTIMFEVFALGAYSSHLLHYIATIQQTDGSRFTLNAFYVKNVCVTFSMVYTHHICFFILLWKAIRLKMYNYVVDLPNPPLFWFQFNGIAHHIQPTIGFRLNVIWDFGLRDFFPICMDIRYIFYKLSKA